MMKAKKGLLATVLCLMLTCTLALGGGALLGSAASGVAIGQVPGTNYLKHDVYYVNQDFETYAEKEYTAESFSDIYLANAGGKTISTVATGATAIGNKSLLFTASADGTNTGDQLFSLRASNFSGAMTDNATYYMRLKMKSNAASQLFINVRNGWANEAAAFLAEFRLDLTYAQGALNATTKNTQGWTGANQLYKNEEITFADGVMDVYFEFDTTTANTAGCVAIEVFSTFANGDTMAFDDIQVGKVGQPAAYYTVEHDVDYDSILDKGDVWENQPIWGNTIGFETDSPLVGTASVKIEGSGGTIGGFTNNAPDKPEKNFSNQIGKYYFQFDIDVQGFTLLNFWTLGEDYWSVQFTGGAFKTEGKVANFKAVDMTDFYRVSFYVTYSTENVGIKIDGTGDGYVMLDNLIIAREDYAPYVSDGTINRVDKQDVEITLDNKDKAFTSLAEKDGETLTLTDDYTITNNTLTLKKELFDISDKTFVYATAGGETEFTVSVIDDRTVITGVTADKAVTKEYDGTLTASLSGVTLSAAGITGGDEVTVTTDAAYETADAANESSVVLSNIVLSGADASKYRLDTTKTYTISGKITPKQLTVTGTSVTKSKVYDGTATAAVTPGTISGELTAGEAGVTASAAYNSKNVADANKIDVIYTCTNANYSAPVAESITEGVSITAKAITVTADSKSMKAGETEPTLTYKVTGLIEGDSLTGALACDAGAGVGEYDITVGTLTGGTNYAITFTGAKLTVTAADVPQPGKKGCGSIVTGMSVGIGASLVLLAFGLLLILRRKKSA